MTKIRDYKIFYGIRRKHVIYKDCFVYRVRIGGFFYSSTMHGNVNGARDCSSYQIFFAINDWHTSIWTVKTLNYDSVFGDIL